MFYKNLEIHNAAEFIELEDGITWRRFPGAVCRALEKDKAQNLCTNSTGVELRFLLRGEEARITMAALEAPESGVVGKFHVYRGAIQGGWMDHELHRIIGTEPKEFVFKNEPNMPYLKRITAECGYDFDPQVIRVIFDRGHIKITDVQGDILPPADEQLPQRTLLCYGSSITHGSNALDMSHAWASVVAHRLHMDCRNLGMAGSCAMEPSLIDYIATQGQQGKWDVATLELGINVLEWEESKIYDRVTYAISEVAGKNPTKQVVVISPFYCDDDYKGRGRAARWREIIPEIVERLQLSNVHYKSGLDFIDSMALLSADLVHPNIYGVQQIADRMTAFLKTL